MRIFKFIKRYKDFNKVLVELNRLRRVANIEKAKCERSAANNKSTLSSYQKKKVEYERGKAEAYDNILKLISVFIEKGSIIEIK